MKDFILLKNNFSKIVLKLDGKENGLKFFGSVLSSVLKIGIIFANFSLFGYTQVEIDRFITSARILLMT